MTEAVKSPGGMRAIWRTVGAGWVLVLAGSVVIIALSVHGGQTLQRMVPSLFIAAWLAALAFISIGTFRLTGSLKSIALRLLITTLAALLQGVAYYLLLVATCVRIYLWVGGRL